MVQCSSNQSNHRAFLPSITSLRFSTSPDGGLGLLGLGLELGLGHLRPCALEGRRRRTHPRLPRRPRLRSRRRESICRDLPPRFDLPTEQALELGARLGLRLGLGLGLELVLGLRTHPSLSPNPNSNPKPNPNPNARTRSCWLHSRRTAEYGSRTFATIARPRSS